MKGMVYCPCCGAQQVAGGSYCGMCGMALTAALGERYAHVRQTYCPGCGARTGANNRYCASCGTDCCEYTPNKGGKVRRQVKRLTGGLRGWEAVKREWNKGKLVPVAVFALAAAAVGLVLSVVLDKLATEVGFWGFLPMVLILLAGWAVATTALHKLLRNREIKSGFAAVGVSAGVMGVSAALTSVPGYYVILYTILLGLALASVYVARRLPRVETVLDKLATPGFAGAVSFAAALIVCLIL